MTHTERRSRSARAFPKRALLRAALLIFSMLTAASGVSWTSTSAGYAAAGDNVTYLGNNARTSYAASETTITAASAPNLTQTWTDVGKGSYVGSQPMVANGIVYWGDYSGYEHATNASTGADLWTRYLGSYYSPSVPPGVGCTPDQMGVLAAATVGSVNGQTVGSPTALSALLGTHKPGDRVDNTGHLSLNVDDGRAGVDWVNRVDHLDPADVTN